MANKNTNLQNAKYLKDDEFYTTYETIEEELSNYKEQFKDKTVLCNCDDPFESNFCLYFFQSASSIHDSFYHFGSVINSFNKPITQRADNCILNCIYISFQSFCKTGNRCKFTFFISLNKQIQTRYTFVYKNMPKFIYTDL